MSTYEEMVMDREIGAAWLTFRSRLADHLAELSLGDELILRPHCTDGEQMPYLRFALVDDETLTAQVPSLRHGRFEFDESDIRRLTALGTPIHDVESDAFFESHLVDQAAQFAQVLFHHIWAVVHPSFITVTPAEVVLYDQPQRKAAEPIAVPDIIRVSSRDELAGWVDRVLADVAGYRPQKTAPEFLPVTRGKARSWVRVGGTEPIVEVWGFLASGVDEAKAKVWLAEVTSRHRQFRFVLQKDRLYAVATVMSTPFVPQQLTTMIERTLDLVRRIGPALGKRLASEPGRADDPAKPNDSKVDPRLMTLFASAHLAAGSLADLAMNLSGGASETLNAWLLQALRAGGMSTRALDDLGDDDDELMMSHSRALRGWRRVSTAINAARRTLTDERSST